MLPEKGHFNNFYKSNTRQYWAWILKLNVTEKQNIDTVEPPISNHLRCKGWMVTYGRRLLTRIKPQGLLPKIYFMEIIYYMQSLSYNMCSSMLNVKFFVYSKKHSTHSKHKISDNLLKNRFKKQWKIIQP